MEQHKFLIRCDSETLDSHPIFPNIIGIRTTPPPPKQKKKNYREDFAKDKNKRHIKKKLGFKPVGKFISKPIIKGAVYQPAH